MNSWTVQHQGSGTEEASPIPGFDRWARVHDARLSASAVRPRLEFGRPSSQGLRATALVFVDHLDQLRRIAIERESWGLLPTASVLEGILYYWRSAPNIESLSAPEPTVVEVLRASGWGSHLAEALLSRALLRGVGEIEREEIVRLLAEVLPFPSRWIKKLHEMVASLSAGRHDVDEAPRLESIRRAGDILTLADELGITATGIGPVVEGGIGVAWSNERVAADVEIGNDGGVVFSYRVRGQKPEFLETNPSHRGEVQSALRRVADLHTS